MKFVHCHHRPQHWTKIKIWKVRRWATDHVHRPWINQWNILRTWFVSIRHATTPSEYQSTEWSYSTKLPLRIPKRISGAIFFFKRHQKKKKKKKFLNFESNTYHYRNIDYLRFQTPNNQSRLSFLYSVSD